MDLIRHGRVADAAVSSGTGAVTVAGKPVGRRARKVVPGSAHSAVRTDLDLVFRSEYRRVVGVAARILGPGGEAEDVAQDVFVAFDRSSVPAAEARGWLCVASAHTALNLRRSGRRRASREEAAAATEYISAADVAEAVLRREERERVRAALARLPRKHAVALVLRHSGLSYSEVASALDLSPGSVGTTLRRAETALRKELTRHASSE